ncbi:DedA family protein [Planktotalea sp.]|uniref:DedA family protein n=1 Tax=Planktotalea sp. TaxID=2029877 RepID=UPI0032982829
MTEIILDLITNYGVIILLVVTFLSCLCLPVPSSLMMLAGGSFAATGDLNLASTLAAAYFGAVAGDNTGYFLARTFGTRLNTWLEANPKRAKLRDIAKSYMDKKGPISVFLSCWLVAPLGPYVNLVSGLTRYNWAKFALWGALGEVVWVGIYIGLGYSFSNQITTLASMLGNASGFIVALLGVFLLGRWLWKASGSKAQPQH